MEREMSGSRYEPQQGDRLGGRYLLDNELGKGGFAVAWHARDAQTGTDVAVKHPRFKEFGGVNPDSAVEQGFNHEINLLRSISDVGGHARIMQLLDTFTHDGLQFSVVELIDGDVVEDVVGSQGLGANRARQMGIEVCDIMSFIHENEIVYRDLKPDNVMQTSKGPLKLIDLNAAARHDETLDDDGSTEFGRSPFYSPEMQQGKYVTDPIPLGPHTDVYSIGKFLFYLLAGHAPTADSVRPTDFGVETPNYLAGIIETATAEKHTDRYNNTLVLQRALEQQEPKPPTQSLLRRIRGPDQGAKASVSPGDTLGRAGADPAPAISIQDQNKHISAVQVQFHTDSQDRWYLQDHSTNGTYVNKGDGEGWYQLLSDRGRQKQREQGRSISKDFPSELEIERGDVIALVHPSYGATFKFLA